MYMKSQIGRTIGVIVSMSKDAAEAALSSGTHVLATADEVQNAGFQPGGGTNDAEPEVFPEGYKATPIPGGFELVGPDDKPVDDVTYPNLPAARAAAQSLAQSGSSELSGDQTEEAEVLADAGSQSVRRRRS